MADRQLFTQAGPHSRNSVIDELVPVAAAMLVSTLRPEYSPEEQDDARQRVLDRYNEAVVGYDGVQSMLYENPVYKIEKTSGLWLLYERTQSSPGDPEFVDWMEFLSIVRAVLDGVALPIRITALLNATGHRG